MIKNTSNAEHYHWGESCDGWRHLDRPDLSLIQEQIPPGAGERRHQHELARQIFFVLTGSLGIELAGTCYTLGPEDSLEVPPQTLHRVWNPGKNAVRFFVVSAPTSRGDRVDD